MKRQYLGDSKDSFKWDYHDFLLRNLEYNELNAVLMMTPDDQGSDGKTKPELFPAMQEVIDFCNRLRVFRDPEYISELPETTKANYSVSFHKPNQHLSQENRGRYFSGIKYQPKQVLFLDPDNGFEPEREYSEKHVRYSEIETILNHAPSEFVVSVFQHFRRINFVEDFSRIRERLGARSLTGVYWHSLMFVALSSSSETISRVREINLEYSKIRPVKIIV